MSRLLLFFIPLSLLAFEPLPIDTLSQEVLAKYYPLVIEELSTGGELQNDGRTRRITREYGYSFFRLFEGDDAYQEPPSFLQEIADLVCEKLGHPPQKFTNFIISLYDEGYHLEPHVDIHEGDIQELGFCFDERVYGVILEPDPTGHLYFIRHEGRELPPLDGEPIYWLEEYPGMIFCLEGPLRYPPYCHGVSAVANRRISMTFRSVHIDPEKLETGR